MYYHRAFNSYTDVMKKNTLEEALRAIMHDRDCFHAIYEFKKTIPYFGGVMFHNYELVKSVAGSKCAHIPTPLDNCYVSPVSGAFVFN